MQVNLNCFKANAGLVSSVEDVHSPNVGLVSSSLCHGAAFAPRPRLSSSSDWIE